LALPGPLNIALERAAAPVDVPEHERARVREARPGPLGERRLALDSLQVDALRPEGDRLIDPVVAVITVGPEPRRVDDPVDSPGPYRLLEAVERPPVRVGRGVDRLLRDGESHRALRRVDDRLAPGGRPNPALRLGHVPDQRVAARAAHGLR